MLRKSAFLFTALVFTSSAVLAKEIEIPRSVSGDKGKYYLVKSERKGDIVRTIHKRVGVDSIGYTKCEINCKTMQYRDIGYSEESIEKIKNNPSKWTDLVNGSSKSDLVSFVCK